MKCKTAVLFTWLIFLGVTASAQESAPLHLVQTITMSARVDAKSVLCAGLVSEEPSGSI
jgi:hypothetical protein